MRRLLLILLLILGVSGGWAQTNGWQDGYGIYPATNSPINVPTSGTLTPVISGCTTNHRFDQTFPPALPIWALKAVCTNTLVAVFHPALTNDVVTNSTSTISCTNGTSCSAINRTFTNRAYAASASTNVTTLVKTNTLICGACIETDVTVAINLEACSHSLFITNKIVDHPIAAFAAGFDTNGYSGITLAFDSLTSPLTDSSATIDCLKTGTITYAVCGVVTNSVTNGWQTAARTFYVPPTEPTLTNVFLSAERTRAWDVSLAIAEREGITFFSGDEDINIPIHDTVTLKAFAATPMFEDKETDILNHSKEWLPIYAPGFVVKSLADSNLSFTAFCTVPITNHQWTSATNCNINVNHWTNSLSYRAVPTWPEGFDGDVTNRVFVFADIPTSDPWTHPYPQAVTVEEALLEMFGLPYERYTLSTNIPVVTVPGWFDGQPLSNTVVKNDWTQINSVLIDKSSFFHFSPKRNLSIPAAGGAAWSNWWGLGHNTTNDYTLRNMWLGAQTNRIGQPPNWEIVTNTAQIVTNGLDILGDTFLDISMPVITGAGVRVYYPIQSSNYLGYSKHALTFTNWHTLATNPSPVPVQCVLSNTFITTNGLVYLTNLIYSCAYTDVTSVALKIFSEDYSQTNFGGLCILTGSHTLFSGTLTNPVNTATARAIFLNWLVSAGKHESDYLWDSVRRLLSALVGTWSGKVFPISGPAAEHADLIPPGVLSQIGVGGYLGTDGVFASTSDGGTWQVTTNLDDSTGDLWPGAVSEQWPGAAAHDYLEIYPSGSLIITNPLTFWDDCAPSGSIIVGGEIYQTIGDGVCSNITVFTNATVTHQFQQLGPVRVDTANAVAGCTPGVGSQTIRTAGRVSAALIAPSISSNLYSSGRDIYVHTARPSLPSPSTSPTLPMNLNQPTGCLSTNIETIPASDSSCSDIVSYNYFINTVIFETAVTDDTWSFSCVETITNYPDGPCPTAVDRCAILGSQNGIFGATVTTNVALTVGCAEVISYRTNTTGGHGIFCSPPKLDKTIIKVWTWKNIFHISDNTRCCLTDVSGGIYDSWTIHYENRLSPTPGRAVFISTGDCRPSTTNLNVTTYSETPTWDSEGTGLVFDDVHGLGQWQRLTQLQETQLGFSIASNLVNTAEPALGGGTNNVRYNWGIDAAVIIPWWHTPLTNSITHK